MLKSSLEKFKQNLIESKSIFGGQQTPGECEDVVMCSYAKSNYGTKTSETTDWSDGIATVNEDKITSA